MEPLSSNQPIGTSGRAPRYDAETAARSPASGDPLLAHARAVIALVFGPVATRTFDVRYWDGSIERCGAPAAPLRLGINRPGALRRMLLPPSELSMTTGSSKFAGETGSKSGRSI